jgi:hypothetical protein
MGPRTCAQCGGAVEGDACASCAVLPQPAAPGLLAMPGRGDSVWTRVALVVTTLATVGIAAWLLFMTLGTLIPRR